MQYYGVNKNLLSAIAERQKQKVGLLTAGSWIPIISEKEMRKRKPDYLAAIEARGFIFAAPLSQIFKIPLIMIRKKGKLPPPVIKIDYSLEYGKDTLEVSSSVIPKSKNILIIDDIIATGGTVNASIDLINKTGNDVIAVICLMNLNLYKEPYSVPIESIIDY